MPVESSPFSLSPLNLPPVPHHPTANDLLGQPPVIAGRLELGGEVLNNSWQLPSMMLNCTFEMRLISSLERICILCCSLIALLFIIT